MTSPSVPPGDKVAGGLSVFPTPDTSPPLVVSECELAELVDIGQRSGLNLHRARHGFALDMRRAASLEAASQALGHADLAKTMRHHGHRAEAFEPLVAAREER